MKILILNGSPHQNDYTQDLIDAFAKGARGAGHEVVECAVGTMNIKGCLGCNYCQEKGEGKCIQKDDMEKVYPELASADMIVLASPVHYFFITVQLLSVISRFYALMKPAAKRYALIANSADPDVYAGIEGHYKSLVASFEAEDMGIKEVVADDDISESDLSALEAFGASI